MEYRSRLFCWWQAQRHWVSVAGMVLLGIAPLGKRGWYGAAGYGAVGLKAQGAESKLLIIAGFAGLRCLNLGQ